ncbi:MAG: hypothetical protein IT443_09750 [Phycisphaeraceae bacterium]|nr:hypothetical protein [Phycisphaeraceae bacterium]
MIRSCASRMRVVGNWLAKHALPGRVIFCCFAEGDAEIYRRMLQGLR